MKKLKLLFEIPLIMGGSVAASKIVIPIVKTTTGIKKPSDYKWNGMGYEKVKQKENKETINIPVKEGAKETLITKKGKSNSYSYNTPKIDQEKPNNINEPQVEKYAKYWKEWNNFKGSLEQRVGQWLTKYVIDRYFKQKSPLTASNFWTMFEEKLLKLKYGSEEIKKQRFYDIMEQYFWYFKEE